MIRILKNVRGVITPTSTGNPWDVQILEGGTVVFNDDTIVEVGSFDELSRKYSEAQSIDGRNGWALPGFVDPHTHPVFYRTREGEFVMRIQGKSYEEIAAAGGGIRNSVRAFREASTDEITELTYHRVRKFLEYGTTTIEAKSGYGLSVEDEIRSLRILKKVQQLVPITIVPTFLGAHEIPDEYRRRREAYVDLIIQEMIPRVAEEKLAVFCDVFCEQHVFTVEESERILLAARDHGLIPKLHADELAYTGGAELAARVKAISADHLLRVSDQGIQAMKEAGVIPVLLPGTAFFLGKTEYAPARKMIAAGLPVALATDYNPGSSTTHNMQFMFTLAGIYMKMLPRESLVAATYHAARAIQMDQHVGCLEPGKKADMVLLDIPNLEYLPYHYAMNHVKKVIRHGRVVYEVVE
ncbi:MAG: imidazolonepropionase [Calditrichaeota bacterium]|nr:imidazolonepropionase [Calditrichota bacterium]